jgi:Icc-related predicted phosphoesterase
MKLLIIGDLHGNFPKIHFKNFDAVIMTGDVCSDKGFRPIKDRWMKELDKGSYIDLGIFMEQKLGKRKITQLTKESMEVGRKILEKMNKIGKPIFIVPGNWDESYGKTKIKNPDKNIYTYARMFLDFYKSGKMNPKLIKGLKNIKDCHYHLYKFKEINILGFGLSSARESPVIRGIKRRVTERQYEILKKEHNIILNRLRKQYKRRDRKNPTIFLSHNVPYETKLDEINIKGKMNKEHYGSTVARWFCDVYQPMLCIGGHMHEHFNKIKLKRTTVINAGFGKDANILLDISEKGKIRNIEFYKGYKGKR